MKILTKLNVLILACLALNQCFGEITDEQLIQNAKKMEQIMQNCMKNMKIPGATFSLARKGKELHFFTIGKTTIDSNFPIEVDSKTLFPISSVSKNITAILVGILVDEGKLSFDDKVRKYVPTFFVCNEELSNEFTVLDLISHRSGFKHFSADSLFKAGYENEKILGAFRYLKQKPGYFRKYYGYQNIIFGVVGTVIENATGEKYEDLVQRHIFSKMGMTYSSAINLDAERSRFGYFKYLLSRFSHDKKKLGTLKAIFNIVTKSFKHKPKNIVINHDRYIETIRPIGNYDFFHKFPATSGISLSAEDFAKWLSMLANKGTFNGQQIISKETFEKITSNITEIHNVKDDDVTFVKSRFVRDSLYYGAGIFKAKYADNGRNAHNILYHMGGIYGATAFFAVAPEDDLSVGVICNLGGVSLTLFPEYMVNQFLDICFGFSEIDWGQAEVNRKNDFKQKQCEYHKDLSEKNPEPMEKIEQYVGTYESDLYGKITIYHENGSLFISNGIKKAKLSHVNGGIFSFPSKDILFIAFDDDEYASFFKDDYGNISKVYISCFSENDTMFTKQRQSNTRLK
ncbi:MAG: serine hydrolase [Holosporales bacterium]|nr:serine hydrolase [Holosporales bacterium]